MCNPTLLLFFFNNTQKLVFISCIINTPHHTYFVAAWNMECTEGIRIFVFKFHSTFRIPHRCKVKSQLIFANLCIQIGSVLLQKS